MDEELINKLKEEILVVEERLRAVEIEQRRIREDILSGNARERMQKRMLNSPGASRAEKKEKIAKQIKIEI